MSLQVVNLHHRNVICNGESLGKRCADQKRTQQAGATCEGYGVDLVHRNASLLKGGIHHGNDVLLMGT